MNQQDLLQRLSELSGMTRAIYCVSEDQGIDTIAVNLEQALDDLVERLQSEEHLELNNRFRLEPDCNHYWVKLQDSHESFCPRCGIRNDPSF